ncbi:MAG: hypothetical protein IKX21_03055 [Deltaproteobacteria bacterium]|nr:hypothetical protein [Deltaproteobacteria bacterium]
MNDVPARRGPFDDRFYEPLIGPCRRVQLFQQARSVHVVEIRAVLDGAQSGKLAVWAVEPEAFGTSRVCE